MTVSAQDRARKIKIILFDVDGVLTDGTHLADSGAGGACRWRRSTTKMVEAKGYSAHDGAAISLARLGGLKCGMITKRITRRWPCARAI